MALDSDSKVVPSFLVGKRTNENARVFLNDLSDRLAYRIQLSSDALIWWLYHECGQGTIYRTRSQQDRAHG